MRNSDWFRRYFFVKRVLPTLSKLLNDVVAKISVDKAPDPLIFSIHPSIFYLATPLSLINEVLNVNDFLEGES